MRLEFETNTAVHPLPAADSSADQPEDDGAMSIREMLEAGIKAAQNGERNDARRLLLQVTEAEPRNETAWLWMASISEYPEELLVFLDNVLDINPKNTRAVEWRQATEAMLSDTFVRRGAEAVEDHNEDFARQCFMQAVAHDSRNEAAWRWLAEIADSPTEKLSFLKKIASSESADQSADKSLQAAKKEATDALLQQANRAAISGNREAARAMLAEILEGSPNLEEAWILKSYLADSFSEKITAFEKVLSLNPENEMALAGLASLRETMAKTEAVKNQQAALIADFDRRLAAEGMTEMAGETVACPFCRAENDARALVCGSCRTILSLTDLEMFFAPTYADEELLRETVEILEAEANLRPLDAAELKNLAVAQINLKDFRHGAANLQKASQMNPHDSTLAFQADALKIRLAESEQEAAASVQTVQAKKVLIADDSATVRKLIADIIEASGNEAICAADGVEAIAKIRECAPDLVLLDIMMPQIDGYQVCKFIRSNEATRDVPVVMISGKDGFFDKVRGRMAGTTRYITKPFGPQTLMKALGAYLPQMEDTPAENAEV